MAEEENKDNQYVVLARKYRPQNFEDLLGQDALVQTLTNAIKNNRLHHAYILTGIRGVGKTTTARLIANPSFPVTTPTILQSNIRLTTAAPENRLTLMSPLLS